MVEEPHPTVLHVWLAIHCSLPRRVQVSGIVLYFWFMYGLGGSTTNPKFDQMGIPARDLQIMDSTYHVPEMLA